MSSLSYLATVTASTKRSPAMAGGKVGAPAAYLGGVKCTPLDPVDPELRQRMQLETAHELVQTFVVGALDIITGDILVVGSVEYPIRAVANWAASTRGGDAYLHLILEDLKR
jgi:hypothetical protein